MSTQPAYIDASMRHLVRAAATTHDKPGSFRLTCVVPVCNESAGIPAFLTALLTAMADITPDFEAIVVDDGSSDDSADCIRAFGGRIRCIELSRNFGKEIAIQAGLDVASGDCTVILDADFQHPVELIAEMVVRWQAGAQMVYAVRRDRNGESWLKRTATSTFYRLLSMSRQVPAIPANAGDFRLLDRKVVDALCALPERDRFMKGLYAWVGFRSEPIEFSPGTRARGESKFGRLRLLSLAATGLTSFSSLPLRWVTGAGVLVSIGALAMAACLTVEKLVIGQPIAGFTTLSASIFFFSGVQLLGIGIVGEYVGRVFNEVKRRPCYLIAHDTHASQNADRATIAVRTHGA